MRGIPGIRLTALALAIACLGAAVALVAEPTPSSAGVVARGPGKAQPRAATFFAVDKRGDTAAEPSLVKAAATAAPQPQPTSPAATGDADSGDLSHPAALLLAAIGAIGFVGSRLRD